MTHCKDFFRRVIVLTAAMLLIPVIHSSAQGNKKFYLVDSLDIASVSKEDKAIMDSILTLYHKTTQDTAKLQLLDHICISCSENIWALYDKYIYRRAGQLLAEKKDRNPAEIRVLKQAMANSMTNNGLYYTEMGEFDKAIQYYEKGLKGFEEIGDKTGISNTTYNIGYMYLVQQQLDKAIGIFLKNIPVLKEVNNLRGLAATYNSVAGAYHHQGHIEKALENYLNCLKIHEQTRDSAQIAMVLTNLGGVYYNSGDLDAALKYFESALQINERLGDDMGITHALDNMVLIFTNRKDYEKSLQANLRSLKIKEETGDKRGIALSYGNMALNYRGLKNYKEAEKYFHKAIQLAEELQLAKTLATHSKNLSSLYLEENKLDKAKQYGTKALTIAKKINFPEFIQQAAAVLEKIYRKQNNWKDAYEMNELSHAILDTLGNMKHTKALLKTNYEYEYQKQKLADSLVFANERNLKNLVISQQESQLSKEKTQRLALYAFLGFAIIITSVVFFGYKRKQKDNQIITTQKKLVEQKNAENELLLAEIHHRVKNNLQIISSLLNMQERNIDNEKARSAIMESKERVRSMELIHKMLYRENFFGGVEIHEYLKVLTDGLIENFGLSEGKNVEVHLDFEPTMIDIDTAIPLGLILNELIVNSFKYAKNASEKLILKIALKEHEEQLSLSVSDNGNGKKSDVENSDSFGLRIIKALVKQLNGTMEITDQSGLNYDITLKTIKLKA
jgi:two-component system, sensor histidine kinase PdtaS